MGRSGQGQGVVPPGSGVAVGLTFRGKEIPSAGRSVTVGGGHGRVKPLVRPAGGAGLTSERDGQTKR